MELGKLLRPMLPIREDVHLVVDSEHNQLLFHGPEVVTTPQSLYQVE